MWDSLLRPIHDHLPLWLLLLPVMGGVSSGLAKQIDPLAVRHTLQLHRTLSVLLCVWLILAYEPLKPASSPQQAALFGPIEQVQFRDSFQWVGDTRTTLVERTTADGQRRTIEVPVHWGPDIRLEVGVDGINLWFVALSLLLIRLGAASDEERDHEPIDDAPHHHANSRRASSPWAWQWLEASLVGTFLAMDVVLFVVCWSSTVASVIWLLGRHGNSQRSAALRRFGKISAISIGASVLGLAGLVLAGGWLHDSGNHFEAPLTFSIPELVTGIQRMSTAGEHVVLWGVVRPRQFWLLAVGFSGALGLLPFHRGLVEALVAAPRGVSVVLVGAGAQIGLYGWLRFILPLFPDQLREFSEVLALLVGLCSLGAALRAFAEEADWRKRIAFATCASMGLSLLGFLTQTNAGLTGGLLRILSHGLTAGLLLWMLPRRIGDRRLLRFALLAWIGIPGLSGFVPEWLTPFGLFQHDFNAAALSLMTSGLLAWMWVRAERQSLDVPVPSWTPREACAAGTFVILILAMGFVPQWFVDRMQPSVQALLPRSSEMVRVSSDSSVAEAR
jgi:NADH-quinone oxidoreductase subunit M